MPLALDLISALESGWILPVATTTRARSPRSTLASLAGSISWLGLRAALTPKPAPRMTTNAMAPQMIRRRRFLPFFPFVKPLGLLAILVDPRDNCRTVEDTGFNDERFRTSKDIDERNSKWSKAERNKELALAGDDDTTCRV